VTPDEETMDERRDDSLGPEALVLQRQTSRCRPRLTSKPRLKTIHPE